jgi:hypothetical protein
MAIYLALLFCQYDTFEAVNATVNPVEVGVKVHLFCVPLEPFVVSPDIAVTPSPYAIRFIVGVAELTYTKYTADG